MNHIFDLIVVYQKYHPFRKTKKSHFQNNTFWYYLQQKVIDFDMKIDGFKNLFMSYSYL